MAILDTLPGLVVSISVAGKDMPEYENRDEEIPGPHAVKTVLRYIESISDSEFVLNLRVSPPFRFDCPSLLFKLRIDGENVAGRYCRRSKVQDGCWSSTIPGQNTPLRDGTWQLRKFTFTSIKTIEDSDTMRVKGDIIKFSKVGQIEVGVFRVKTQRSRKGLEPDNIDKKDVAMEVAEKALKGKSISHRIGYSPPIPCKKIRTELPIYLDGADKPIAIFRFKYLSKVALQQQLVIPRSPSPDPFDALTSAGKERLARQKLAELKPKTEIKTEKRIKREHSKDGDHEIVDLSEESFASNLTARPFKMIKMPDGNEAIDLTE